MANVPFFYHKRQKPMDPPKNRNKAKLKTFAVDTRLGNATTMAKFISH